MLTACVNTLNDLFCDLTPRTGSGALDVIDNQLQNIGGIQTSGFDFMLRYRAPEIAWGQFSVSFIGTILDEFEETTANIDGTSTVTDRTGTHTNETFQRAFPELRTVTTIDWLRRNWSGSLTFRWTDSMDAPDGSELDSAMFTDLRLNYAPEFANDALTLSVGINNLLDEDPPIFGPSTTGMSNVVHDLPGRVAYVRFGYER